MQKSDIYSSALPNKLPLVITHKGSAGCVLSLGIFFLIVCAALGMIGFYMSKEFLNYQDKVARMIPWAIPGLFTLLGIIVLIILMRQEYDEKIEITDLFVNYERKGKLRKTVKWSEQLNHYAGILKSSEAAVEDSSILTIVLKHKLKSNRNVVLNKEANNDSELNNLQNHFAQILKKPPLN